MTLIGLIGLIVYLIFFGMIIMLINDSMGNIFYPYVLKQDSLYKISYMRYEKVPAYPFDEEAYEHADVFIISDITKSHIQLYNFKTKEMFYFYTSSSNYILKKKQIRFANKLSMDKLISAKEEHLESILGTLFVKSCEELK